MTNTSVRRCSEYAYPVPMHRHKVENYSINTRVIKLTVIFTGTLKAGAMNLAEWYLHWVPHLPIGIQTRLRHLVRQANIYHVPQLTPKRICASIRKISQKD